jgi:hypothetical protein
MSDVKDDDIYRIYLSPHTNSVEVMCLGMNVLDHDIEGEYSSVDDLPDWVQERLALLMMTEIPPPRDEVDGVGMRVDADTFWVFRPVV